MTAYEIYKQASEKAREIEEVARALQRNVSENGRRTSAAPASSTKDYCMLRAELRAMLTAEYDAR